MRLRMCNFRVRLTRPNLNRCHCAALLLTYLLSAPVWAGSVVYTYDTLGRITQATYSTGVIITYVYDAAGNRTSHVISGAPL
jgi:YD repeat-containing protein